jgi:pentatricopeptide repeat protein
MHLEERRKRRRDIKIISGLFFNVSYTTFISGLFQAGRVLEAKELFKDIRAQSHFPDLMTYSTLLDGLRKQGYLDQALGLFHDMQKSYLKSHDLVIYDIIIIAMCRSRKLKDALELFSELSQRVAA